MSKKIELLSRYKTVNSFVVPVYEWNVSGDSYYRVSRSENDPDEIFMLDPDGGPCLTIGSVIDGHHITRMRRVKDGDCLKYLLYVE